MSWIFVTKNNWGQVKKIGWFCSQRSQDLAFKRYFFISNVLVWNPLPPIIWHPFIHPSQTHSTFSLSSLPTKIEWPPQPQECNTALHLRSMLCIKQPYVFELALVMMLNNNRLIISYHLAFNDCVIFQIEHLGNWSRQLIVLYKLTLNNHLNQLEWVFPSLWI